MDALVVLENMSGLLRPAPRVWCCPKWAAVSAGWRCLRLASRALSRVVAREVLLASPPPDDSLATSLGAASRVASLGQRAALPRGVVTTAIGFPTICGPAASLVLAGRGAVRHASSSPQSVLVCDHGPTGRR